MNDLEHCEQVAVIEWWRDKAREIGVPEFVLFAIPNGGWRVISVARKLKTEGVRAGIPDLFLALPAGKLGGLFIEMKKPKGGRLSPDQKIVIPALKDAGYEVVVANGRDEAIHAIEAYLAKTL